MCFVFSDSFPSPLIRGDPSVPHHISSLFDSGLAPPLRDCAREMVSANAARVNNCELSCSMLPPVFDVIRSCFVFFCFFSVASSAAVKSASLHLADAACVLLGCFWLGPESQLTRLAVVF